MKKIWRSKTIYLGILNIAIGVGLLVLGEQEAGGTFLLNGFGIILLRLKTNTAVSIK